MKWTDGSADVLAFSRDPGFVCMVNVGVDPAPLPEHRDVLLASAPLTDDGQLAPDTAIWLAT
jgi:alpha-glucosidase